jgi:hypothetical protein
MVFGEPSGVQEDLLETELRTWTWPGGTEQARTYS